jgi:hypothetical protein
MIVVDVISNVNTSYLYDVYLVQSANVKCCYKT